MKARVTENQDKTGLQIEVSAETFEEHLLLNAFGRQQITSPIDRYGHFCTLRFGAGKASSLPGD